MFRRAALTIVLLLAAGPPAAHMCLVACAPGPPSHQVACPHDATQASVGAVSPDACDTALTNAGVLPDTSRVLLASSAADIATAAIVVCPRAPARARGGRDPQRAASRRPRALVLRV